jgi:hypothetical protein
MSRSHLTLPPVLTTQRDLEQRLKNLERQQRVSPPSTGFRETPGNREAPGYRTSKQTRFNGQTVLVQGDSLKTFSFASPQVERVQVRLGTEGRPLSANIELWQGPDNTPYKLRVYNEDGKVRPFNAVILTPGSPNTVAIRNTGQMEFPMAAAVSATTEFGDSDDMMSFESGSSMTIQGGALRTFPFDPTVESVQVLLKTDGRPLNARIELLQGPNNNKQVLEIYCEDGFTRPFFVVIETPGSGNVVRVVNTSPVEFPMYAAVEAYRMARYDPMNPSGVVIGGDSDRRW